MAVYSDYQVYGPYVRKDKRKHVVLIKRNAGHIIERKTVSYPKFVVEVQLDIYLTEEETVDHIDGNFENDALSNLRVVPRSLHSLSHVVTKKYIEKVCTICGNCFVTNDVNRIICDSKSCAGSSAHLLGHNMGCVRTDNKNEMVCNRELLDDVASIATIIGHNTRAMPVFTAHRHKGVKPKIDKSKTKVRVLREQNRCINCGTVCRGRYCLVCYNQNRVTQFQQKHPELTRNRLKQLIRTTPFTTIASQFGVTDNAIRKWCMKYNLPYKVSEIKRYSDDEWETL